MAREKGTGNLQQEKSGRWTIRVGINGRRLSRSTGTRDRDKAEAFLNRFLAPMGLGAIRLPLAEAWHHYEMSPNRRDVAKTTLASKRTMWMCFARWMEQNHIEIGSLAEVTETAVGEYLAEFRCHHSATTYNNHVCALREVFRTLAEKAGVTHDPWAGVCLRSDDSVSRRELTLDEVERLYAAASKEGAQWKLLVMVGIYTGLRLGDCCRLKWDDVCLDRSVIQVIPEKTKRHMHGRPVTIPIHPQLQSELQDISSRRGEYPPAEGCPRSGCPSRGEAQRGEFSDRIDKIDRVETPTPTNPVNPVNDVSKNPISQNQPPRLAAPCGPSGSLRSGNPMPTARAHFVSARDNTTTRFVNPAIAELYLNRKWQIAEGLRKIFKMANITMSVRLEGRSRKSVVASFHSLRHTFVSFAANAGVPLSVVQSIVGHTSTAMTRHYYHESEDALRAAVAAIPSMSEMHSGNTGHKIQNRGEKLRDAASQQPLTLERRLRHLEKLRKKGLVTDGEYQNTRTRIMSEL